jgi:hypothetical protein
VFENNTRWFDQFVNDPENNAVFLDRAKYLERVGGVEGVAKALTKQQLEVYGGSVDAASIVFIAFCIGWSFP